MAATLTRVPGYIVLKAGEWDYGGNSPTPVAPEVTPGAQPESSPLVENPTPLEDGPQQSVAGQNLYVRGQMPEMAVASPEADWEQTMPAGDGMAPSLESAEAQERRGGGHVPPQEGTATPTGAGVKRDTTTSQDGIAPLDSAQSKKTRVEEQSSTERNTRQPPAADTERPQRRARVAGPEAREEMMEESTEGAPGDVPVEGGETEMEGLEEGEAASAAPGEQVQSSGAPPKTPFEEMQRIKLAEFLALKQKAASQAAAGEPNEPADLSSKNEYPDLEGSERLDLGPTAKQVWQYVDENPYFQATEDSRSFRAAFCVHETAAQAAVDMARLALQDQHWCEPTCELPLTLRQEGFGELRFRHVDVKWRDDRCGVVKAINKLRAVYLDSARAVKEGPKSARHDPNRPERVPDDHTSLSIAADWEESTIQKVWAEGLRIDGNAAALQPPWPTELGR
eukprot:143931-Rhodomonas_salina.1